MKSKLKKETFNKIKNNQYQEKKEVLKGIKILLKINNGMKLNEEDKKVITNLGIAETIVKEYEEKSNKHGLIASLKAVLCIIIAPTIMGQISCAKLDLEKEKYKKEYDEVISSFCELLEENNYDSPNEIFDIYSYALENEYLPNSLKMSNSDNYDISDDTAEMLKDIYQKMGYEAFSIYCYNDDKINKSKNLISIVFGNHEITCVLDQNNKPMFFDPSELNYLNKNKIKSVEVIDGEGKYQLKYLTTIYFSDIINTWNTISKTNEIDIKSLSESTYISDTLLKKFYEKEKDNYPDVIEYLQSDNSKYGHTVFYLIALLFGFKMIEIMGNIEQEENEEKEKKLAYHKQ